MDAAQKKALARSVILLITGGVLYMGQPPTPSPFSVIFMSLNGVVQHASGVNWAVQTDAFPHKL